MPATPTTPARRQSLWLGDTTEPLVELAIGNALVDVTARHPDTTALVAIRHGEQEWSRWTYAELLADARRVAGGLLALAQPGDHVALWAPNVAEWPIIEYGAALAGVTLVALNPVFRAAELRYALEASGATLLVHADTSREYDMAAVAADVAAQLPAVQHRISLSDTDLLFGAAPADLPSPSPTAPAMMQFTSGTTGRPKGVVLSHRSMVNNARLTLDAAEVPDGVVAIAPLPMFHTAACVISTLGPLSRAGTMVLIRDFTPGEVLQRMQEEDASLLFSVPTVLGAVLEGARQMDAAMPRLATVLVGGATAPGPMIAAVQQTFGASVHNLFGQTELSPVLSLTRRDDTPEDLITSVGRPLAHTDCRIVDPQTGRTQPLGVEGEICARGYLQMIGYHEDPEATAATVDADGWVHTGDLGTMDHRGMLTVTGRLKELIIRGGENIAPAEIEICLAGHPDVLEAAVVGMPDERWGEVVAAVVRTRRPVTADTIEDVQASLVAHCRTSLSPFKVPSRWHFRDELPHTASGKVQKFVLRDQLAAQT